MDIKPNQPENDDERKFRGVTERSSEFGKIFNPESQFRLFCAFNWFLKNLLKYICLTNSIEKSVGNGLKMNWREILQRQDGGSNFQAEKKGFAEEFRNLCLCIHLNREHMFYSVLGMDR